MSRIVVVKPAPMLNLASAGAGIPGREGLPGIGSDRDTSPSTSVGACKKLASGVENLKWSVCGGAVEGGNDEYGIAWRVKKSVGGDTLASSCSDCCPEATMDLADGARLIPSDVAKALIDELTVDSKGKQFC